MNKFSIKQNLKYKSEVFFHPKSLINEFLSEERLFIYSLLPLLIFTGGYECLYIFDYISQSYFTLPITNLLRVLTSTDNQYYFYQMLLFPLIHLVNYIVLWLNLLGFSKLFKNYQIDEKRITYFSIFTWNTLGLIALIGDIILHIWPSWWILTFLHPLCGLIGVIYRVVFTYKLTEITKGKAAFIYITSWIIFIGFRMLFLG